MLFSKQEIFCNTCGAKMNAEIPKVVGRDFRCCSMACLDEMKWRETLSIMGEPYKPKEMTPPDVQSR